MKTSTLAPKLQLTDATALVVSNVIGVGIFTTPAIIASMVPAPRAVLALWLFGGMLAFAGAVTYAELGKLLPHAGGEYVYLSRAFGPLVGFLSGWTSLIAGFAGALAAGAVALASYLGHYFPVLAANVPVLSIATPIATVAIRPGGLVAAGVLLSFAVVHALGWGTAKVAQKTLALLVLGIIALFVIAGFGFGRGAWGNFQSTDATVSLRQWWLALIPVMFTYSGWNAAAYVTEEIRDPERTLGRALALGTVVCIAAYLALNALFIYALPQAQMTGRINVGDVAAQSLFAVGGGFVTPLLIVALAGASSAMTAAGPRVYFAMARDGVFASWVGRVHPTLGTPVLSIALQTSWAIVLALFGGFEQILLYTGFAVVLGSGAAAVALFVLQRRAGMSIHPVRNVVMPAAFAVSALVMVLAAINQAPKTSLVGLLLIGAGTPVYWFARRSAASRVALGLGVFAIAIPARDARPQAVGATDSRYEQRLFSALRWRNIGPNRAGRSLAAAGSPTRPYEYYAGAVGGGLWKTTDGGANWRPATDGQIKSSSVGAVAVAESNPDIVYIGMGEVQVQRNMLQGDGVYASRDAGRTWTHAGLGSSHVISRIRVHPANPDVVFVAAFGSFYGPGGERGVYRSKDGGTTWSRVLFRDDSTGAVDLAMSRQNPDVMYAGLWQASVSPEGAVSSGGPGSGLFKSVNGGDTWTEITRNPGLPPGVIGKIGVAVSGADINRVYALVEAESGGGIFRSDDGGATWNRVNEDGQLRQRPSYFNRIYADPNDKDVVWVQNLPMARSTDGGRTFVTVQGPHVDHHDLWIAPNDSRRMIDANDGGPTVSINGGESWTAQDLPTAQLYHVTTTRDLPYHVCGAQQDASAVCVASSASAWRSTSPYVGSGNFSGPVYAPGGGEFGTVVAHPGNPDVFFATGPSVITRYDRRTGLTQARDIHVQPLPDRGPNRERFATIAPIVFSRREADVVYVASQHVWRSADGGMRWSRASNDLTRGRGSVFTIAPSYHDARTIWVGTDDGVVQVSRDGGAKWTAVTPPTLPVFSRISHVEASPHQPGTAYVVAKRFEWDDRAPYIYRSDDFGGTWRLIVAGIPASDFVHVVREDPTRPGLLFAGTEHGVHVSFNGGDNWQSLGLNLPDTQVPDLVVERNDLVIATHGRSFYVLDDISPLRQMTPHVAAAAVHLFQPREAIRRINTAAVDYVLGVAAPASIEILDAKGTVVRNLRSEGRAGLNRVVWDLRYESAAVFPGMIMWVGSPNGPIAAPGNYTVRLTASGQTKTQPLLVRRDPRATDVTDSDIQEQFTLALKARDRISDANNGVTQVRSVRPQIQARSQASNDARIAALGDSLSSHLSEVEGQLYQVRLRSQLDAIQYPMMLNNRLANLKLSIETGDGRPTAQAYAAFRKLSSELDVQLARLDGLLKTDVVRFNRLLTERSLEPVRVVP